MSVQANVPDEIDFNDSDVANANKRRQLSPTGNKRRIRFVVTNADKKVSEEKGTMMLILTCAPLRDPDNAESKGSPTVRHSLIIPKRNKDFPGHTAPNTMGLCHGYYSAVDEEMLDYPRFDKDSKVYLFNDEELEKDDVEEKRLEVGRAVADKLAEDWKNPANRIDDAFFAEVIENKGFTNLRSLSAELPEDCDVVPPDEWMSAGEDDDEEAEEESDEDEEDEKPAKGKANGKAKPAAKKPAAKAKGKKK